jgi:hypothetical protein
MESDFSPSELESLRVSVCWIITVVALTVCWNSTIRHWPHVLKSDASGMNFQNTASYTDVSCKPYKAVMQRQSCTACSTRHDS